MPATLHARRWLALWPCFASFTHSRLAAEFTAFLQQNSLAFYDLNVTLHPCVSSDDFLHLVPFVALCLQLPFPHTYFFNCNKYYQKCGIHGRRL